MLLKIRIIHEPFQYITLYNVILSIIHYAKCLHIMLSSIFLFLVSCIRLEGGSLKTH